jgi:hypothetical protein
LIGHGFVEGTRRLMQPRNYSAGIYQAWLANFMPFKRTVLVLVVLGALGPEGKGS